MRQEPASDQQKPSRLDEASIDRLRHYREVLSQRFNDHTAGKLHLPPEQSLALRSHITQLTQLIEPGTKEMWPDFSREEQAFMEKQAADRQRGANALGIAVLGPLAAPAYLAEQYGAPPETVSDLLQVGAGMLAMEGLGRGGFSSAKARVGIQPVPPEVAIKSVATEPVIPTEQATYALRGAEKPVAPTAMPGEITTEPGTSAPPETFAQRMARTLQPDPDALEAMPIHKWYNDQYHSGMLNMATLDLVIQRYSTPRQELLADLRASQTGGKSIDDHLHDFRSNADGFMQARNNTLRFTARFLDDICSDSGELESGQVKQVIEKIRNGSYLDASEYASLRYLREFEHTRYVEDSVTDITNMSRIVIRDEAQLIELERTVRANAENNSPYRLPQQHDRDHQAPDNAGPEPGQH